MDAAEVEFLAEKELVTIIPNFSLDKIYLIGVRVRRAFASGTDDRGRRLALLCSLVSGGKPGGGLGVSSPRALRGRGWGAVRSRQTWAGAPGGRPRLPGVPGRPPAAPREPGSGGPPGAASPAARGQTRAASRAA